MQGAGRTQSTEPRGSLVPWRYRSVIAHGLSCGLCECTLEEAEIGDGKIRIVRELHTFIWRCLGMRDNSLNGDVSAPQNQTDCEKQVVALPRVGLAPLLLYPAQSLREDLQRFTVLSHALSVVFCRTRPFGWYPHGSRL
jgi:hypothetical protein